MGISTSFIILDVLIDLLYFIIIFKYDCHALELVRTSIYNMAAAEARIILPIQRIDWPLIKMDFQARAAGKNFLEFLDNSYNYVQEPDVTASFPEKEAHRKDQIFVSEKQKLAWSHLHDFCKDNYMYILQAHQAKPFDERIKDTWTAIVEEMEGSSDAVTPSDIFTQALEAKMLDTGNVRLDFKNYIAKIDYLSEMASKFKCTFADGFKLAIVKRGLSPELDFSQNLAAINGSKTYPLFVKAIETSIESTFSLGAKRRRLTAAETKTMHEDNERTDPAKLFSAIMTNVLEEAPENATHDEIFGLISAQYAKRNKQQGHKFWGKCFDCKQTGHRKGDPQCPGPLATQQPFRGSSASDETGSFSVDQSVSSASGSNPTYVINIPKDYAGSPLFFPSSSPSPVVGAAAQFPSSTAECPIIHHTFQQEWSPPLPSAPRANSSDYRSTMASAQRPSKFEIGRGLIGMGFAKTS